MDDELLIGQLSGFMGEPVHWVRLKTKSTTEILVKNSPVDYKFPFKKNLSITFYFVWSKKGICLKKGHLKFR